LGNPLKPRLVVLDDHITPYRIPIFTRLQLEEVDLRVLYCSARLPDRQWEIPKGLPYPYEILPNLQIRLRRAPFGERRIILFNPTLAWRLLRLWPDVVVGYAYSLPTWTAFAFARLFGKRFISWSTDTLHTERHIDRWQRLVRRVIIPRADAYLTPSSAGHARFVRWGAKPDRVRIAPQAPDVGALQETLRAFRHKDSEGGSSERPVILYVGSLSERKGVSLLLDSFRHVHAQLPHARLHLVGEGPLRGELMRSIETLGLGDAVRLVGFVPHAELATWYARATVFVQPTLEDTYAVVLAEAAACGLPIVTTPFAGAAAEVVREGFNGVVADPRDPQHFARKILAVLSDKEELSRMSRNSIEMARGLGPEVAARRIVEATMIALG
jgi:glycosyltransferase involved in cell wall biosynthesis